MKRTQRGGLSLKTKQAELLTKAIPNTGIWFYKEEETGRGRFDVNQPSGCNYSTNRGRCGIELQHQLPRSLCESIDEHIKRIDPGSEDKYKCFLLVSDLSKYGLTSGYLTPLAPVTSRILHTEMIVGKSLMDSLTILYGTYDEHIPPNYVEHFCFYRGKIYGIIYLGYVTEPGRYAAVSDQLLKQQITDHDEWGEPWTIGSTPIAHAEEEELESAQIINKIMNESLPPNISTKYTINKPHPTSRWRNDTYEDRDGAVKNYCDPDPAFQSSTMKDIFLYDEYNFLTKNCQGFCKAFMSILRCWATKEGEQFFMPMTAENGKDNLKLDVTQLSAVKKSGNWLSRNYGSFPNVVVPSHQEPEPEPEPEGGGVTPMGTTLSIYEQMGGVNGGATVGRRGPKYTRKKRKTKKRRRKTDRKKKQRGGKTKRRRTKKRGP